MSTGLILGLAAVVALLALADVLTSRQDSQMREKNARLAREAENDSRKRGPSA